MELLPPKIFGCDFEERHFREFNPGDDQRLARAHDCVRREIFRHRRQRRRVAAADVLDERRLNGLADFFDGQFHAAKMAANGNAGKQNPPVG